MGRVPFSLSCVHGSRQTIGVGFVRRRAGAKVRRAAAYDVWPICECFVPLAACTYWPHGGHDNCSLMRHEPGFFDTAAPAKARHSPR